MFCTIPQGAFSPLLAKVKLDLLVPQILQLKTSSGTSYVLKNKRNERDKGTVQVNVIISLHLFYVFSLLPLPYTHFTRHQ